MMSLRVAVVNVSNIFSFREITAGKYEPLEGIEYELLKVLSEALKFNFTIVTPKDKSWGNHMEDGSWTGMVGMLARNEADIIVDYLMCTEERSRIIEFSFPYVIDSISFAVQKSPLLSKELVLERPFTPLVWTLIAVSLVLSVMMLQLFEVFDLKQVHNSKWCRFLFILFCDDGVQKRLRKTTRRAFILIVRLQRTIVLLTYSVVLLSFLMIPLREPDILTFKDLADAVKSGKKQCGVRANNSAYDILMKSNDQNIEVLRKHIRQNPQNLYEGDQTKAIQWIMEKGGAVIDPSFLTKTAIHETGYMNNIFVSTDSIAVSPTSVGFKKGFCCKKAFEEVISRITEAGLYEKWHQDILLKLRLKAPSRLEDDLVRPLSLKDIIGAFIILALSYILAFIFLFAENRIFKRNMR